MESFLIAEKYIPKNKLFKVAKCILLAQDIREASWDEKKEAYQKNDMQSAIEAVKVFNLESFWIEIIHGWNVNMWNDCQIWAQDIIGS